MALRIPVFLRSSLILVLAQIVAQLTFVAFTPVLTRMYGPEQFGIALTLYSVSVIFGLIASLRLDLAVVISNDDDAPQIYMTGAVIAAFACSLAMLTIIVLQQSGVLSRVTDLDYRYLILVPVMSLAYTTQLLSLALGNRFRKYGAMGIAVIVGALTMVGYAILLGPVDGSGNGLLVGRALGIAAVSACLVYMLRRNTFLLAFKLRDMIATVRQHRRYSLFNVPYSSLEAAGAEAFPVMMIAFSRIDMSGYYALIRIGIVLPVSIASAAMGQVFFRDAVDQIGTPALERRATAIWSLISSALAPFLAVVLFFGPWLFGFVFGEGWHEAGKLAALYVPSAFVMAMTGFPARIYEITQRQDVSLKLAAAYFGVKSVLIYTFISAGLGDELIFAVNAAVDAVYHVLYLYFICRVANFDTVALFRAILLPAVILGGASAAMSFAALTIVGQTLSGAALALVFAGLLAAFGVLKKSRSL